MPTLRAGWACTRRCRVFHTFCNALPANGQLPYCNFFRYGIPLVILFACNPRASSHVEYALLLLQYVVLHSTLHYAIKNARPAHTNLSGASNSITPKRSASCNGVVLQRSKKPRHTACCFVLSVEWQMIAVSSACAALTMPATTPGLRSMGLPGLNTQVEQSSATTCTRPAR